MNAWFSEHHRLHSGLKEFSYGEWLDGFELPVRADAVRQRFVDLKLGTVRAPRDRGLAPLAARTTCSSCSVRGRCGRRWAAATRRCR